MPRAGWYNDLSFQINIRLRLHFQVKRLLGQRKWPLAEWLLVTLSTSVLLGHYKELPSNKLFIACTYLSPAGHFLGRGKKGNWFSLSDSHHLILRSSNCPVLLMFNSQCALYNKGAWFFFFSFGADFRSPMLLHNIK